MKVGSILTLTIDNELIETKEAPKKLEWDKESELLLLVDQHALKLNPREVSGMRLYIDGNQEALELVQQSLFVVKALEKIAKFHKCVLLQIQTNNFDYLNNLNFGFYCSNIILEADIETEFSTHNNDIKIESRKLSENNINKFVMNEYMTRIMIPGGTPSSSDYYSKIKEEYTDLSKFDHDKLKFTEFFDKDNPKNYMIKFINEIEKTAIRCFTWVSKKSRGKGLSISMNSLVQESLRKSNIKSCFSFTSVSNIAQIKNSCKSNYNLHKIVINRDIT